MDLFLRKPLRPRSTPADWMARMRSSLFWRLKYGISSMSAGNGAYGESVVRKIAHNFDFFGKGMGERE